MGDMAAKEASEAGALNEERPEAGMPRTENGAVADGGKRENWKKRIFAADPCAHPTVPVGCKSLPLLNIG